MTDQLKQQIITVAEYDGMSSVKTEFDIFFKKGDGCSVWNWEYHLLHLDYPKSDTWIMPVARKVWKELTDMFMERSTLARLDMINNLEESAFKSTSDLFQCVYNAIIYIQELKQTK